MTNNKNKNSQASPPAYLTSTSLCHKLLPLAIITTTLAIAAIVILSLNANTLYSQVEASFLMSLSLGMMLLVSCILAVWKKTFHY